MLIEILPCSAHQRQLSVMLVFHSLVLVLRFSLSPLWLNVQAKKKKQKTEQKETKIEMDPIQNVSNKKPEELPPQSVRKTPYSSNLFHTPIGWIYTYSASIGWIYTYWIYTYWIDVPVSIKAGACSKLFSIDWY